MGGSTELGAVGAGFVESRKKIIRRVIRHLVTIIHPISASKMERASIFLHAASGFLKKIFTRGGVILNLVETGMNTEGIHVCSVSISKELY